MILVKPSLDIEGALMAEMVMTRLERIGRLSHQSEEKMGPGTADKFIRKWAIEHNHESILRHEIVTVRMICSRATSHQIVRHGLAAFLQESQRYCCYKGHVKIIIPRWADLEPGVYEREQDVKIVPPAGDARVWLRQMFEAEQAYHELLECGRSAEEARGVLPNDAKTELFISANLQEWRHIFRARTSKHADPAMREIMTPALRRFQDYLPVIFEDLGEGVA